MPRHGENIRKRKDGRWEGRYYAYEPQRDKKVVRSVYARTYAEVKEKLILAKISAESERKLLPLEKGIDFNRITQEWLEVTARTKKYSTYIKYRSIYDKYIKKTLLTCSITEFDSVDLSDVFQSNDMKNAPSESVKKSIVCVLNQILSYAQSQYHINHLHITYHKQNDICKSIKILNQTEQSKLLRCLYHEPDIYKVGILICIHTGIRLGEICSLKWTDIDLKEKILYVNTTVQRIAVDGMERKTKLLEGTPKSSFSKREIPLSEDIIELLIPYYSTTFKYVLNGSRPMEPRTYQNKFQGYLKMAGVEKKNFHALRHTFATNCINSGTDVKSLSEILGHSDVKITLNRYVHPTLETKRQHMNSLSSIYGQMRSQG